jgi:DNA polymerase
MYLNKFFNNYQLYQISKEELLKRVKFLIRKFNVSPYDFWSLIQKRPQDNPYAECLWHRFEIKPQDVDYVISVIGRDRCKEICSKGQKLSKNQVKDIFTLIANNQSKTVSKIQQRLEKYKQWVIDQLKDKQTSPMYEGCVNCPLRYNEFVPPDYIINDPNRDEVDIVFVGMNPYEEERKQGKPFVGQSGQYLRSKINQYFNKHNIVITNCVMCYIPDNGDPDETTIQCCNNLLKQQLKMLKPKVVMTLGALATQSLLGKLDKGITKIAGQVFNVDL